MVEMGRVEGADSAEIGKASLMTFVPEMVNVAAPVILAGMRQLVPVMTV